MSKSHHLTLVAEAKSSIDKVFFDTSVPRSTTLVSLEDIRYEIDGHLSSFDETDEDEYEDGDED